MKDHDAIIEIRGKVNAINDKLDRWEGKLVFKDMCDANHSGNDQRMDHIEGDVKELKEGNNNRTTLIMAGIAIILATVVPIVAALIQYVH